MSHQIKQTIFIIMKSRTKTLLIVMNVLTYITFIGLMIKAGAIAVTYTVSIINPDAAKNMYMKLDLYDLKQFGFWSYTLAVAFKVAIIVVEAYTAYLVITVLSKIRMNNPFTIEIAEKIEKISYYIFAAWITAMASNVYTQWLMENVRGFRDELVPGEFIFVAGIVFIVSQIFKKGVELQTENELTV